MSKFFIATAIDYVNGRPHVGHAFEKVIADVVARYRRLKGDDVWFTTGTDDNAMKNVQAAEAAGVPVGPYVDGSSHRFVKLCERLGIEYDKFARTFDPNHFAVCQNAFGKIRGSGAIYPGEYEGLYCQGCESFLTEKDLIGGKCPEHEVEPVPTKEKCYFFDLERYRDVIEKFVHERVFPATRANEMLSRLRDPLQPLCVSRPNKGWGISVPDDPSQTVYVWFDALLNYLSAAHTYFPPDMHVIGKGITWFHAVVWPAMLAAAGLELPRRVVVHGYLNTAGKKISKTAENSIDPFDLLDKYGRDAVRYSLARCSTFEDSDYSEALLVDRYNKELANNFGNLISRVSAMASKSDLTGDPPFNKLYAKLDRVGYMTAMNECAVDKALQALLTFANDCNAYIDLHKPWEAGKTDKLRDLTDAVRALVIYLSPFLPDGMITASACMGFPLTFDAVDEPLANVKMKVPPLYERIRA